MKKLIDFITAKSLSDPSMANVVDLLKQNPGRSEDVLLLAFRSIYEANRRLAEHGLKGLEVSKNKKGNKVVVTDSWDAP